MVNTYRILKDKKVVEGAEGPTEGRDSLDYLSLNVQSSLEKVSFSTWRRSNARNEKWKDHDRWHTLEFREFAQKVLKAKFYYVGVSDLAGVEIPGFETGFENDYFKKMEGGFSPRWSDFHKEKSWARIYRFSESCFMEDGCSMDEFGHVSASEIHMITLTVRHPVTGSYVSHKNTVDSLRASWSLVRRWVNSKVRSSGWRYLRVMEPGEIHHYPHYHMVVIGASMEEMEELKKRWLAACHKIGNKASEKGQDIQVARDIKNVGAYLLKYIGKQYKQDDETYWQWMELCYREHIRVYAMDKKSSAYIKRVYHKIKFGSVPGETLIDFDPEMTEPDRELEEPRREPSQSIESRRDQDSGGRAMDTLNGYPLARPILTGVRGLYPGRGPGRSPRLRFPEETRPPSRSGGVELDEV